MSTWMTVVLVLVLFLVALALNAVCKKFVFSKVHVNKWIPLAIAVVLFIIQQFVAVYNIYAATGVIVVASVFFFWFMDIIQTGGPKKKEKQIVIKSKAKPNRVKKDK